jgi:DNA-binding NtrC family response regulator
MPLSTPTAFDGWTNATSNHARSGAIALDQQEALRTSGSRTPALIGQSPVMKKLFSVIERVAPTDASVLITGATGTGKELAARAIHDLSSRRDATFVDINCSAIPETLIEAELFGHQRGTFTGAHENRSGLFEKASGGTLFLDEVDALNLSAQAKLLRVLQERTVRRIGARANIAIDVRIISATNCDLAQAVVEGRFRPDLYYRLRVLPLHLPELCTRANDISLLVEHFLRIKAERQGRLTTPRFTGEAMRTLNDYPWPGNVRELENVIEYALALGNGEELGIEDLPLEVVQSRVQAGAEDLRELLQAYMNDAVPLAEIEKRYILSVLQQFGGNQVRAAAALGIDRSKLYRRLRQYGVKAVKFLQEEEQDGLQFRGMKSHVV